MSETVTVALVGICGYGIHFVNKVLDEAEGRDIKLVAAIARRPERCERLDELTAAGAKIYPSLEEFYSKATADLVIISSPIQLHSPFTCLALSHGSNVLCEKPVAATIQEAEMMMAAEAEAPGFVAIGYQWSFADAVQALKNDVLAGELGKPRRLKTLVSWPRSESYYSRNDWAGALKTANGDWILDSPANNATAHYLHNMLYVLGRTRETSVQPATVQAELYRAKKTENFDTAAIRCVTDDGAEVLFYTSHAVPSQIGPISCYEFENATVVYDGGVSNSFIARFKDGRIKNYGNPNDTEGNKTWDCVDAVRTGAKVACDTLTATPQILCINGAQESMPEITPFPEDLITTTETGDDSLVYAAPLQSVFVQCYNEGILPSEYGSIPWAREGKVINISDYHHFPQDKL